jgi:threonine/homoserine/homoserine lactone efflux protein
LWFFDPDGKVILLFPKIENILRVLGTGYMVWLAFTILRAQKISENRINQLLHTGEV